MESVIPAAIIGVFHLVILYFSSLFFILGPSLVYSNQEIDQIRSHLRKLIQLKYEGKSLTLKEIDHLSATARVERSILNFDAKYLLVIASAVSGGSPDSLSLEIKELRRNNLDAVKENINRVFEVETSAEKIYKKLRRVIFRYRLKSRVAGIWLFSRRVMPGAVDRWGRYVTVTAISAVIIGYSIWFLNGENGIDATGDLISKSVNYLSVGALVSVILAALIEFFLGIYSIYHQRVLGIRGAILTSMTVVGVLAVMILASICLKFNYISLIIILFNAWNVPSEPAAWCIFLGLPLGLHFSLKWCYKTWRLKGERGSSRLFSTGIVFYLFFMLIGIYLNPSKLSGEILSFIASFAYIAVIILAFSGAAKLIEMAADLHYGVFALRWSGMIFCVAIILVLASSGVILISLQEIEKLEHCTAQFDFIYGNMEEYYASRNKATVFGVVIVIFAIILPPSFCVAFISLIRLSDRHSKYSESVMNVGLKFSTEYLDRKNMKILIKSFRRGGSLSETCS